MRIIGLGHAGLLVETSSGRLLCDPWRSPAFFGSWFPFPDNTWLDWDEIGQVDYLYISHLHLDHFDPRLLRWHVRKSATVLLPDYPTNELETELRDLGFTSFVRTRNDEPVDLDGLRVMITSLTGPVDGPVGDSAMSLFDGGTGIFNQNDAHPLDADQIRKLGHHAAHFLQFSGANWWPMAYQFPAAAKRVFAEKKRTLQRKRALRYIHEVGADHVFPFAGPPCLLDDELTALNGHGSGPVAEQSIFTDQYQFLRDYAGRGHDNGHLLLPGTEVELTGAECVVTQPHAEETIQAIFEDKEAYLRRYASRRRQEIEQEKASWADPQPDLLEQLKDWWEPLMARADRICGGIGGPVRFDVGDRPLVLDFPARQVRDWSGEHCRYRISVSAELVATNIARREVDWQNSLFLSMRFSAKRIGPYNEYLFTFFTCLSVERIDYVENWYDEQNDDGLDVVLDGWTMQLRCPHLRADLSRFGRIEGTTLTCDLHGWRFDLETGSCLTAENYSLRVAAHP
jgi:UDP-MurNAc hydroxylase